MNETKLECCPECGSEAAMVERRVETNTTENWWVTVGCTNKGGKCDKITSLGFCGIDGNGDCDRDKIRAETITAWNDRARRMARGKTKEKEPMDCPVCGRVNKQAGGGWAGYECMITCHCGGVVIQNRKHWGVKLPEEKVDEIAIRVWNSRSQAIKEAMGMVNLP